MKRPNVIVTIDDDSQRQAKLIGYDRDRYYYVQFLDDGSIEQYKGGWLLGLEKLKPRHRFLLNPDETHLNNKDLWKDFKEHTRGSIISTVRRSFGIFFLDAEENTVASYHDLNFKQLKSKARCAMQLKIDFYISIGIYYKSGSNYGPLLTYAGGLYTLYDHHDSKTAKYYGTFERGLAKVINSY